MRQSAVCYKEKSRVSEIDVKPSWTALWFLQSVVAGIWEDLQGLKHVLSSDYNIP